MSRQTELLAATANCIDTVLQRHGIASRVTGGRVEPGVVQFYAPLPGWGWLERDLARMMHITTCHLYLMIEVRGDENGA